MIRDLNLFFEKILEMKPDIIMGVRQERQHNFLLRLSSTIYDLLIKHFVSYNIKNKQWFFRGF